MGDRRRIAPLSRSICWERALALHQKVGTCVHIYVLSYRKCLRYVWIIFFLSFPIASNLLGKQQSVLMAWDETACSGHLVSVLCCPPFEPPFPLCSLYQWWLCICTVFSKYFTVCLKWNLTFSLRLLFTLQLSSLKSIYWPKPKGSRAQIICHLPTSPCVASKDCALTFL